MKPLAEMTIEERYNLLRDAVNDFDGPHAPDCNSYGHGEGCRSDDWALALERQQAEIARLTRERDEYVEREAACCPEDRGFDEVIAWQRAEIARLRALVGDAYAEGYYDRENGRDGDYEASNVFRALGGPIPEDGKR